MQANILVATLPCTFQISSTKLQIKLPNVRHLVNFLQNSKTQVFDILDYFLMFSHLIYLSLMFDNFNSNDCVNN